MREGAPAILKPGFCSVAPPTPSTWKFGRQGLEVSAIGFGCMGMSQSYGPADEAESIASLHRAIELGCNCFDTAENYGPFTEELLCRAQGPAPPGSDCHEIWLRFLGQSECRYGQPSPPGSTRVGYRACGLQPTRSGLFDDKVNRAEGYPKDEFRHGHPRYY
jgi:Aldo/keto reductase family